MAGTLGPILTGIISILEGGAGVAPMVIPAGTFVHADTIGEFARSFVSGTDPRPFLIGYPRIVDSGALRGDATSGTYARRSHEFDLNVAFVSMRPDQMIPVAAILEAERLITDTLEYELSVATVAGWEGCTVTRSEIQDMTIPSPDGLTDGCSPFKVLSMTLRIDHREEIQP